MGTVRRRITDIGKTALLTVFLSGLSGCCEDKTLQTVASPDGRHTAVAYERDCGATVDFATRVNLHSSADGFSAEEGLAFVVEGRQQLQLVWTDSMTLKIVCPTCSTAEARGQRVFRNEAAWNGVRIQYSLGNAVGSK
jgi:hypothetical protein